MDLLAPKLLYVGDNNTYSSVHNVDFELIHGRNGLPSIVYIDVESDESEVVEVGRCIVGCRWGTPWLYIPEFEIAKPYRGRGYGASFFNEVKRFAKHKDFSYIWIRPKENDEQVRKFWVSQGGTSDVGSEAHLVPRNFDRKCLAFDLNADDRT